MVLLNNIIISGIIAMQTIFIKKKTTIKPNMQSTKKIL